MPIITQHDLEYVVQEIKSDRRFYKSTITSRIFADNVGLHHLMTIKLYH